MPAYKDEERGTWYSQFYYKDWTGKSKQKRKRGFKRERDAKQWERDFLNGLENNPDITFGNLDTRLKPATMENWIVNSKLLPYFKDMKIADIDALVVRRWQNEMLSYRDKDGTPYADTYLKTINNQLSAILNYAVAFYKLKSNPCKITGSIGKTKADAMQI